MAAGGGNRNVRVTIGGDADGARRAFNQTAADATSFAGKMKAAGRDIELPFAKIGSTVAGVGKAITVGAAGVFAASTMWAAVSVAAVTAVGAAAVGTVAAIAGIGLIFAAQSAVVQNEWKVVTTNMQQGMQQASAAFEPVLLNLMHQANDMFNSLRPGITFLMDAIAPVVEKFGSAVIEGLGKLTPLFVDLIGLATPFISMLSDHIVPLFEKVATFTPSTWIVGIIQDLVPVVQQLAPPVMALISLFGSLGGPVLGTLMAALPAVSAFLTALVDGITPILSALTSNLGPILSAALTAITPLLAPLSETLTSIVNTLGPVLGEALGTLVPAFTSAMSTLLPPVQKVLEALTPILPMLADLAGTVLTSLATAIAPVVEALAPFITQLMDQLQPVFEDLKPIIEDLGEQLGPLLADNISTILPPLLDLTEALLPLIPPVVEIIAQFLIMEQTMRGAVLDAIVAVCQWLQDVVPPIFDRFVDGLKRIGGWMQTVAGWIVDAWNWVWDKVEGFVGFVTGLPDRIRGALTGLWDGLKAGLVDALNAVIYLWNNFELKTPDVPGTDWGGQTIQTPNIEYLTYDKGGQVGGQRGAPVMALVHAGETILPTHRMGLSEALAKVLPQFNLGGVVGGVNVYWNQRRYVDFEDGSSAWQVWTDRGWGNEGALRKKQEQEFAALRFLSAMQQRQTDAAKSIGSMRQVAPAPAASSVAGSGGDRPIYVYVEMTGSGIVARVSEHQRAGGNVPWVKAGRR